MKTTDISDAINGSEKEIIPGMSLKALMRTSIIRARFEDVLGKKSAGFMSSIISAVSANKSLLSCDPTSVISAAMIAATLDLPINPSLGMAHIVPYKGVATFQIGWKGIYQLAMRSGQFRTINVATVFEGELVRFDKFKGDMEFDEEKKTGDSVIGYVLFFELLNGFRKFFYMTAAKMESHGKSYSQSYKKGGGVWVSNFEAMAHKTVAKLGLGKFGPLSIEMHRAFVSDQAAINEKGEPEYLDTKVDHVPENESTNDHEPTDEEKAKEEAAKTVKAKASKDPARL